MCICMVAAEARPIQKGKNTFLRCAAEITSSLADKLPQLFRSHASLYDENPQWSKLHMKVAVITGAAQSIGRRTAEVLAEHGYALALIDLREPAETVTALKSMNADMLSFAADITSEEAVAEFARAA